MRLMPGQTTNHIEVVPALESALAVRAVEVSVVLVLFLFCLGGKCSRAD